MTLELLANELLHEIFEYLDAFEILRSFHNINNRFDTLLCTFFHAYRINFHSVVKYRSEYLSRHYLPIISNKVISIRLSNNDDESSPQTDLFYLSNLSFDHFIHLRSLSLSHIDCQHILRRMLPTCQQISYLKIIKCNSIYMNSIDFSNIIWSLPRLTHCCLVMDKEFNAPSIISVSLEYLSISCSFEKSNKTFDIFHQTPALQHLRIPLNQSQLSLPSVPSITTLKLSNVHSYVAMMNILQSMPNLTQLKIDAYNIDCDGHRWEEIINNHLPKLNIFRLRMHNELNDNENDEQYIVTLFESFRSRFWLEKHQWYIRCHYQSENNRMTILLYTLPYGFVDLNSNKLVNTYKTTCPQDNTRHLYDQVKDLTYNYSLSTDHFSLIQFSNIRHLAIHLCFDKFFWKNVPIFYQLISVMILSTDRNAHFHIQSLFDRAPCLYSLTIRSWQSSKVPLRRNTNTSLRRLDLCMNKANSNFHKFTETNCKSFIESSIVMQCEELLIEVENRQSILDLVNGMNQLRMLRIQCTASPIYDRYTTNSDTLISWLQDHLPSTYIIAQFDSGQSKIWIHLKKF